jgi:hypothetical protein
MASQLNMSREFLIHYTEEETLALTGLSSATFHLIYERYCGHGTPIRRPAYLFWLFQFYKLYPVARAFRSIYGGKYKHARSFMHRLYTWQVRKTMNNAKRRRYRYLSKVFALIDCLRLFAIVCDFHR